MGIVYSCGPATAAVPVFVECLGFDFGHLGLHVRSDSVQDLTFLYIEINMVNGNFCVLGSTAFNSYVLPFMHMEPPINESQSLIASLKKVTSLSKFFALVLFVSLPFLGAYVGYQFAPIQVVEVQHPVTESISEKQIVLPSLSELQSVFSEQISDRLAIEYLYTTKGGNTSYFKSFIPNSSSCCGVYKYNPITNRFLDTGIAIDMMSGEKASADGRYIAKVNEIFLEVYDLETQSRVVKQIINGEETLVATTCTYSAISYDLEWTTDNTLTYGVYKNIDLSEGGCPDMELLEYRTIIVE